MSKSPEEITLAIERLKDMWGMNLNNLRRIPKSLFIDKMLERYYSNWYTKQLYKQLIMTK